MRLHHFSIDNSQNYCMLEYFILSVGYADCVGSSEIVPKIVFVVLMVSTVSTVSTISIIFRVVMIMMIMVIMVIILIMMTRTTTTTTSPTTGWITSGQCKYAYQKHEQNLKRQIIGRQKCIYSKLDVWIFWFSRKRERERSANISELNKKKTLSNDEQQKKIY